LMRSTDHFCSVIYRRFAEVFCHGAYGWSSATAILSWSHGEANAPRVVECRGPQKVVYRMDECNGYFHQIHGCDGLGSIVIILCSWNTILCSL
jgi:hypothetical protein